MNVKLNTIDANKENLTSLWKTVGAPFQSYHEGAAFNYCEVKGSDWPNRLWFNGDVSPAALDMAYEHINLSSVNLVLPYWDIYESKSYELLENKGFKVRFEQVGMFLKLQAPFEEVSGLEFKLVSHEAEARIWAEIYPKAFGYCISDKILVETLDKVRYYLAFYNNQAVGTAILFIDKGIAGIHGVGVVPEMRRKGFAEEIMKFALNESIRANSEIATLQSSAMGKSLYLKLGFEEQFAMKNYVLQNS